LTVEEFHLYTPEKLELIRGDVPGAEELLLLLLTNVGLHRAATLVGHETWRRAIDLETPPRILPSGYAALLYLYRIR
jgi:hypothetical protein